MSVAPSYWKLVTSNDNFRRVWLGEVVSFLGDWFSLIALYTVVQELTDSTTALAGVIVGKTLPIFLMTPIAGPLADRFDRRWILIGSDIGRAVLALGLMAAWQFESLPLLYTVLSLQMCFAGLFIPARTAVIAQVTDADELPVAMALSGGTWSVMLAFGAALGGLLTQIVGIHGAFLLDGLTYLLSVAFLWGLPSLPPEGKAGTERGFVDGLRYVGRSPWLATVLTVKPAMAVQSAVLVMLPVFGNGVFPKTAGPLFIGLLYSARGLGALLGSMGTRNLTGDSTRAMRLSLPVAFTGAAGSYVLIAWAPNLWVAALGFFLAAVGTGTIWVFTGTLAQRAADGPFRGRVFALEWGLMTLASAGSAWVAGVVVDAWSLSARQVALFMAVYMLVPALLWPIAAAKTSPD
ncbi:MAG: MFS transporter [Proteobacteria bacterium]|nr:MFS transporter [Pseudomonadota bacterium]